LKTLSVPPHEHWLNSLSLLHSSIADHEEEKDKPMAFKTSELRRTSFFMQRVDIKSLFGFLDFEVSIGWAL